MATQVQEVFVNGEKRFVNSKGEYFNSPFMANWSDGVFGWGTQQEVERRRIDPGRGKGGKMPSIYEKSYQGLPPSAAFPIAGSGPVSNQVGSDADPSTPGLQGTARSVYSSTGPTEVGGNYTVGDVTYDGASGQAIDPGTGTIDPDGYSIDPVTSGRTSLRSTPAPDGSGATGTNTGFKMGFEDLNSLVTRQTGSGITDINSFLSEALPVTPAGDEQGKPLNAGSVLPGGAVVEGISTPGQTGTSPVETADNNRAVSVPGEMDIRKLRREAFLNPDLNSMQAMRAADAAIGLSSQGGKFFINDGGSLQEINKDQANKYRSGNLTAQEMKDTYTEGIKETLIPTAQTDITESFDTNGAISQAISKFSTGSSEANPFNMSNAQGVEFHMNNAPPILDESVRIDMKTKYFE